MDRPPGSRQPQSMARIKNFMNDSKNTSKKKKSQSAQLQPRNIRLTHEERFLINSKDKLLSCVKFEKCSLFKHLISLILLFLVACKLTIQGIYLSEIYITESSEPYSQDYYATSQFQQQKVVILFIDSLAQDLVQMDNKNGSFKLFYNIKQREPENAILLPLITDRVTFSSVSSIAPLTGQQSQFQDYLNFYYAKSTPADNVLHQLNLRKRIAGASQFPNKQVLLAGDSSFTNVFSRYSNATFSKQPFAFYANDDFDQEVRQHLLNGIKNNNFTIFVSQLSGLDYAGHQSGLESDTAYFEQKVNQTEWLIRDLIEKMDNKTVLLVAGSHGGKYDGWHGGSRIDEMISVFFAYSKTGFPLKSIGSQGSEAMNSRDIAPLISLLVDIPIPFGNVGQFNNWFLKTNQTSVFKQCIDKFMSQQYKLLKNLCSKNKQHNCNELIEEYQDLISSSERLLNITDWDEMIDTFEKDFSEPLYEKSIQIQSLTFTTSLPLIVVGLALLIILIADIIFGMVINPYWRTELHMLGWRTIIACLILYFNFPIVIIPLAVVLGASHVYDIRLSAIFLFIYHGFDKVVSGTQQSTRFLVTISLIIQLVSRILDQELIIAGNEVIILISISCIWFTQERSVARSKDFIGQIIIIIGSLIIALVLDLEQDLAGYWFIEDLRFQIIETHWLIAFIPLILQLGIDAYISSKIRSKAGLGIRQVISGVLLTLLGFVWYFDETDEPFIEIDANQMAQTVYYLSAVVFLVEVIFAFLRRRDLQDLMTTLLLTLIKPLMLVGGIESQFSLFLCLRVLVAIRQIGVYQQTKSKMLHTILLYSTMSLFFLRTGHRYQLDKLQYIETYLGFSEYSRGLHTVLLFMNTYSSYIIGLLMLPYCSNTTVIAKMKKVPMTRTSIVLNQNSQSDSRIEADKDVRRETQKTFRYLALISSLSLIGGAIKQLTQLYKDQYADVDFIFYAVELCLIFSFGFVYNISDLGKARPQPQEIKVVPKRAEQTNSHIEFVDSDETTSPSTELFQ
ncbi:hypothetical protein FGO68_gene10963 [Halteria grandinella]|uniref:GPI ethanolamine phosphate transferase 1 n=1 Tax=Halteria grandinella TaxID=5974 RepID=A0A8J8P2A6_HALGN|nr:hypothetical protein FGO68_gene10963 [Halteria grandinella]